jgi:DHA3 family multidrug efflux protein-like MFS transporter
MGVFYRLLGNTLISSVTNLTVWFALVFFVYLETRSVIATSVTSGLYFVMSSLSGFWFGSLLDRHRKKSVMLVSGGGSLVLYSVGLALYVMAPAEALADPGSPILWAFVLLLLIGVIAGNIRYVALPALVTVLIPEDRRDRANGLSGTATGLASLIVSAISGLLVGLAGMYWVFILAIALLVVTSVHLAVLSLPEPDPEATRAEDATPTIDLRGTLVHIMAVPGLIALILFTTFNNFLGGVFAGLLDAYGLSLVSVQAWGVLWMILSSGIIISGLAVARWGLGRNPLRVLFAANIIGWVISSLFTIRPSVMLLAVGMLLYMSIVPVIEAAEQTIIQKVVPQERQGRVFGFAQSVELAATPLTTFAIGPVAELVFIPFMTTGAGAERIGSWFGVGPDRGIALVFTLTGIIGFVITLVAMRSKHYQLLSQRYLEE